jgi:hypothetical protein
MGTVAYLTYPAFLFATYAFVYEFTGYVVRVYAENLGFLRYVTLTVGIILFLLGTAVHFELL